MRCLILFASVSIVLFSACGQNAHSPSKATTGTPLDTAADKKKITSLVRQMLNWAGSKGSINLLPTLKDNKDSIYVGFDLKAHELNLQKLKRTGYFATEFIHNYDSIIRTLDGKLRTHEFETWLVGELPTFRFANDVDPWCNCQDVPYDKPNPWDLVEVTVKELYPTHAILSWTWGRSEWSKDWSYDVKATKEKGTWKISWLSGFDFEENTRKDGL